MQQWDTQMTFEELGQSLHDITFVVVDLETTGGSASKGAMITEVGAVKVRGGEVLAEFQTLVNPQSQVPAFITGLTGITNEMVCEAPTIDGVIPAFLEFAHGRCPRRTQCPFDIGFLKHFAQDRWPSFEVIDTARLARQLVSRDEAPNCKLATLAALFDAATSPSHRALADARATVDVLHALIGKGGQPRRTHPRGVEGLLLASQPNCPTQAPSGRATPPHLGVYLFKDASDKSSTSAPRDLRKRVRSISPALKSAAGSA
ncbi:MAG: exonuclease domain-containing protein [Nocardioidaceae bacterium]